jgi:peptide subunit release factor 1 (eRF1)
MHTLLKSGLDKIIQPGETAAAFASRIRGFPSNTVVLGMTVHVPKKHHILIHDVIKIGLISLDELQNALAENRTFKALISAKTWAFLQDVHDKTTPLIPIELSEDVMKVLVGKPEDQVHCFNVIVLALELTEKERPKLLGTVVSQDTLPQFHWVRAAS